MSFKLKLSGLQVTILKNRFCQRCFFCHSVSYFDSRSYILKEQEKKEKNLLECLIIQNYDLFNALPLEKDHRNNFYK